MQRRKVPEVTTNKQTRSDRSVIFFHGKTVSTVGQGLLIIEASRSHSDTPLSVELLWTRDQPDVETYNSLTSGIRTHNPSIRTAEDPCRRRHLDRNSVKCSSFNLMKYYCFRGYSKMYTIVLRDSKSSSFCKLGSSFLFQPFCSVSKPAPPLVLRSHPSSICSDDRSDLHYIYPFNHFRNLSIILRHAALSLRRSL